MNEKSVFELLAEEYPLIYLDPDRETKETYREVVLGGMDPEEKKLYHYTGDSHDGLENVDTPSGPVRVVTLGNRRDFELVLRGFFAAKEGPLKEIPRSQGASMLTVFNWPRINAHLEQYPEDEKADEFKRFTADKANYTDMLVVLSRGPYSNVKSDLLGLPDEEWLSLSDPIRRYHELTHVVCRRKYPGDIDETRDELIADAVGLFAAFGDFDPEKEKLFLGIEGDKYTGGRLENYTDEPERLAKEIPDRLLKIKSLTDSADSRDPFKLIPVLMAGTI